MTRRSPVIVFAALLALAGCTTGTVRNTAGQVTAEASVDAFQLKVGDCTGKLTSGNATDLQVVPCGQPHYYEAYARTDLTDGDFPGDDQMGKRSTTFCDDEFTGFVGASSDDSTYSIFYLHPTEASWRNGDREVLCLAGDDAGGITGTLKGVKK